MGTARAFVSKAFKFDAWFSEMLLVASGEMLAVRLDFAEAGDPLKGVVWNLEPRKREGLEASSWLWEY